MATGFSRQGGGENVGLGKRAKTNSLLIPILGLFAMGALGGAGLLLLQSQPSANANQAQVGSLGLVTDTQNRFGQVPLYVLKRSIPAGEPIQESDIQEVYRPVAEVPMGSVRDIFELQGSYSKMPIAAGELLLTSFLTEKPRISVLPVTPGNRAVTIEVDGTTGIEGMALPGTHVDVVLTHTVDSSLVSKVIVQNTRVLSSKGNATPFDSADRAVNQGKGQPVSPQGTHTVTLDVSPRDALAITTARQLGRLSLHLRAEGDTEISPDFDFTQTDLNTVKDTAVEELVSQTDRCYKGKIRMEGRDYQLTCDDQIIPVPDQGL